MSADTPEELEALRAAGRVVAAAIAAMRAQVRPGVTTAELDEISARVFARAGARSGPQLDYGFPGTSCISVNDEAVHGIPGERLLADGDLVKLDVTAELDGFYADACVSVAVGSASSATRQLVGASEQALELALAVARAGVPLNEIGRAVESTVTRAGYSVCMDLAGHGIGRQIHEQPDVLNFHHPSFGQPLTAGLVITIEPIIAAGDGTVEEAGDGWTLRTRDGSRSAHTEHTIVITDAAPIVLTA
ncbi:MAG TPA: type I methionyl aminopeptidase [Solirubrobacteraceae bacterium]|jgi:methionyl aminopeptidase|nr:type I methionyl aminopeptidase [Solirubrobacteraceae bacterium]